jgi:uncharacterized protein (TIGR02996 family)
MTAELDLLRAIAANPDDDTARRVYADWLIELGSPRGELIQLELALAEMDDFDDRRKATKARIDELVTEHAASWLAPFARLGLRGVRFTLDRGVVGGVSGSARAIAAAAPRILAGAPLVTALDIEVGDDRDLAPLAGSPLLAQIRTLVLRHYTPVRPTGWAALVLPEVRRIVWSAIAVGPDDAEALLAAPNVPKLGTLEISNCRLNRGALEPLSRARFPLAHLDMPAAKQGPRLGELLGGNPAFGNLVTLRIAGNEIGSAGFAQLLPALRHVVHLDVRGCGLAAADLERLLSEAALPAVRELLIGGQPLTDAVIAKLVAWPGAARLRKLNLGQAGVSDRAAHALAACPQLANLRSLVLSGARLAPETEGALVASPHLAQARIYAGSRVLARKPPAKRKRSRA